MHPCEYYSPVTSLRPPPRRRTLLRALPLALGGAVLAPALAACTDASVRLDAETNAIPEVDVDSIEEQPELAALVPAKEVSASGVSWSTAPP